LGGGGHELNEGGTKKIGGGKNQGGKGGNQSEIRRKGVKGFTSVRNRGSRGRVKNQRGSILG